MRSLACFSLCRGDESKKCVVTYNRIAQALLEYQYLYHRAWVQAMPAIMDALSVGLNSTLIDEIVTS